MEAVGLLAGGISHAYNNFLGVILGNADLLLETTPTGVQQHYTVQIKRASRRAAELTRQLLAFSRKQKLPHSPSRGIHLPSGAPSPKPSKPAAFD
jgi:two-component system cell cycle sensor histidine kinase/response regulator CckA